MTAAILKMRHCNTAIGLVSFFYQNSKSALVSWQLTHNRPFTKAREKAKKEHRRPDDSAYTEKSSLLTYKTPTTSILIYGMSRKFFKYLHQGNSHFKPNKTNIGLLARWEKKYIYSEMANTNYGQLSRLSDVKAT